MTHIVTDRADLIRRLEEAAVEQDTAATFAGDGIYGLAQAKYHRDFAALLRKTAKALGGE